MAWRPFHIRWRWLSRHSISHVPASPPAFVTSFLSLSNSILYFFLTPRTLLHATHHSLRPYPRTNPPFPLLNLDPEIQSSREFTPFDSLLFEHVIVSIIPFQVFLFGLIFAHFVFDYFLNSCMVISVVD
jgi:hypothetical protein